MINMAGRKSAASLRFGRTLRYLAAPRWSVLFFILAAAAALWVAEGGASPMVAMPLPLSLLAINLLASIATHPRFRSDLPLLFLHLALISLVSLWLVASLTYVDGAASVTRGTSFDGSLHRVDKGVWHGGGVHRLRFSNEGFVDEFPANGNEYLTYNRVRWWREDGTVQVSEIGDDLPLPSFGVLLTDGEVPWPDADDWPLEVLVVSTGAPPPESLGYESLHITFGAPA